MTKRGSSRPGSRSFGQSLTLVLRRRDWLLAKLFIIAGALLLAASVWYVWPYWQLSGRFETLPEEQPSRLYARSFRVAVGDRLASEALVARLEQAHYAHADQGELVPGTFR